MPANPHSNLPELNYYRSTFCTFNFMASLTFNLTKFEKTSIAGDQRKKNGSLHYQNKLCLHTT